MILHIRARIVKFLNVIMYVLIIALVHILYLNVSTQYFQGNQTKYTVDNLYTNEDTDNKTKYILVWTGTETSPASYLGSGRSIFLTHMCKWNNCFVTSDRMYLQSQTEFDVILFNGPRLWEIAVTNYVPKLRSTHQKYVYANVESSTNYPVATTIWNGFFNWTWTYRLDSDARWGYVAIRNATNHVIGPSINMHWMNLYDMKPIDNATKLKLRSKTKAAVWFASNCRTSSARELFVTKTRTELQKYGLDVDIYGSCGDFYCTRDMMDKCLKKLEDHYYFYFAFENSFSEDYVTEKILYALLHNTVPVVYGGANYTRYMPDGIYLDALKLGPKGLAKTMTSIMRYPELYYYDFFRWKNHYSYHYRAESPDTDDYCQFCAMLNDDRRMRTPTTYVQFDQWWRTNLTYLNFQSYEQKYFPKSSQTKL